MNRASPTLAAFAIAFLVDLGAHADDKHECADTSTRAQQERYGGSLLRARELLLECAREECPPIVRTDCARWFPEVETELPSIVVSARSTSGHEVAAVRVLVDGVVVAPRLDGKPFPVDPGPRVFRYEPETGAPIEETVIVHQGEKNRLLHVVLPERATPSSPAPVAPPLPSRPLPLGAYGLGGAGILSLGVFAVSGVEGLTGYHHLSDTCSPSCASSDVSRVRVELNIAGVALGIGIAAVGVATWMLLTRSPRAAPPSASLASPFAALRF
jgi:hypothetical protein